MLIVAMPKAFWIAVGAAVLVVVAHVALFFLFLRVPKNKDSGSDEEKVE